MNDQIPEILKSFDLLPQDFKVERVNSGHINFTYKLSGIEPGSESYILQRINKNVFTKPEWISHNHRLARTHLNQNFPQYLFLDTLKTREGLDLIYDKIQFPWRVFPFIDGSVTVDEVENAEQAFNAAAAFGTLSKYLSDCEPSRFKVIIPDFHNLGFRYDQFEEVLTGESRKRISDSEDLIQKYKSHRNLVEKYRQLIESNKLELRVTHNDTKINNVLFKDGSNEVLCVIDLDTLMPGYFINDIGDMIRTFVSPVSEEEKDFTKIDVRHDVKEAIEEGYLSQMGDVLTAEELKILPFAGPIMTYMIGMRFLTDHLAGDTYYQISYPGQNLVRAGNQLCLLEKLLS